MVRQGPKRLALRWVPALVGELRSFFFSSFFSKAFFSDFWRCWVDLGRFWEAQTEAKIDFWRFFFDVFFECVSASIFDGFWEAQNLKNSNFPLEKQ